MALNTPEKCREKMDIYKKKHAETKIMYEQYVANGQQELAEDFRVKTNRAKKLFEKWARLYDEAISAPQPDAVSSHTTAGVEGLFAEIQFSNNEMSNDSTVPSSDQVIDSIIDNPGSEVPMLDAAKTDQLIKSIRVLEIAGGLAHKELQNYSSQELIEYHKGLAFMAKENCRSSVDLLAMVYKGVLINGSKFFNDYEDLFGVSLDSDGIAKTLNDPESFKHVRDAITESLADDPVIAGYVLKVSRGLPKLALYTGTTIVSNVRVDKKKQ